MLINVTYFHTNSATYILVLLRKRGIRLYIVIVGKVKKLHIFPNLMKTLTVCMNDVFIKYTGSVKCVNNAYNL